MGREVIPIPLNHACAAHGISGSVSYDELASGHPKGRGVYLDRKPTVCREIRPIVNNASAAINRRSSIVKVDLIEENRRSSRKAYRPCPGNKCISGV